MADKKRTRNPNFSLKEKRTLLECAYEEKAIIENKKTDGVTWKEKETAWERIASNFNSHSDSACYRTVEALKKFYQGYKKEIRKVAADEKMSRIQTGGGKAINVHNENFDLAISIMNPKTITGYENIFDGDGADELFENEPGTSTNIVCALTKRGMMLQPDILPFNDAVSQYHRGVAAVAAAAVTSSVSKSMQQNIIANAGLSYEDVLNDDFQFDMDGHDVMVFLHIQKTGGTSFGRHLVRDLDLKRPCECQRQRKRCYCFRPHRNENWLFSRYSTGWKCGLHADWTELTSCVDQELDKNEGETAKRRYFYITLLREPISRYMSEYRHVRRGATWKGSRHWCLGRQATAAELPPCYKGKDWLHVTLDEFAACDSNLAANRQTRMLADLALVNCYNKTSMPHHERDRVMLASAKRNLAAMAYFGLTEFQKMSQYIFEETFNLRFAIPFEQHNTTISVAAVSNLRPAQKKHIEQLNSLDMELYTFAKNLLFQRFQRLKAKDADFEKRYANLGNINYKQGVTEFNWDSNIDETASTDH